MESIKREEDWHKLDEETRQRFLDAFERGYFNFSDGLTIYYMPDGGPLWEDHKLDYIERPPHIN